MYINECLSLCVHVNDDACVCVRACACVLGKYVLLFLFWVFCLFFFYIRRPHCKLDLYMCTILLMIYVLLSNCVTFVK